MLPAGGPAGRDADAGGPPRRARGRDRRRAGRAAATWASGRCLSRLGARRLPPRRRGRAQDPAAASSAAPPTTDPCTTSAAGAVAGRGSPPPDTGDRIMGTRSVVVVTGRHTQDDKLRETIRLYRHWDGSPDVMLATIATAIAAAQRILARWQDQWRTLHPEVRSVTARCLADALLAASLGMNGMGMRLDDDGRDAGRLPRAAHARGVRRPGRPGVGLRPGRGREDGPRLRRLRHGPEDHEARPGRPGGVPRSDPRRVQGQGHGGHSVGPRRRPLGRLGGQPRPRSAPERHPPGATPTSRSDL